VTEYRRRKQEAYNREHHITPRSVSRAVEDSLATYETKREAGNAVLKDAGVDVDYSTTIQELEQEMLAAAEALQFEKAALLRDQIRELKRMMGGGPAGKTPKPAAVSYRRTSRTRRA